VKYNAERGTQRCSAKRLYRVFEQQLERAIRERGFLGATQRVLCAKGFAFRVVLGFLGRELVCGHVGVHRVEEFGVRDLKFKNAQRTYRVSGAD